jgi:Family of unknown function (DUF6090)
METGKTGKYFKYAIGEIVLVIVGILIALQVNNWNQKRIDTSSYNIILNSLVTDLENDVSELTNLITISKQQNKTISKIINTIKIPKDSLVTVFNILCFTPESFTPNTSSFNILNNHGSFDLLKLKEVSTEVQSLYNSAIKINQESYLDRNKLIAEIIRPFIMKSGYVSIDQKNNILINENELLKILYTNIELKGHLLELFMINNILISERLSPLNDKFKEVANNLKQRVKLND